MLVKNLLKISLGLTIIVIGLGAYTRLSDAGLGCPDWPGCYGRIIVPEAIDPSYTQPLEPFKAWIEMIHRYAAGSLGLLIFVVSAILFTTKEQLYTKTLCVIATLLVIFQALLGMWTVTLRLYPIVVMGHLLGGFSILTVLWLLFLQVVTPTKQPKVNKILAHLAIASVVLQIALGGWTSANYAAIVCPDFPSCQGKLLPELNWREAFNVTQVGIFDSPGTPLENTARVTIQMAHRFGALLVCGFILTLAIYLIRNKQTKLGVTLIGLLMLQITLGITNVVAGLPISVALSHNLIAAAILVCSVTAGARSIND